MYYTPQSALYSYNYKKFPLKNLVKTLGIQIHLFDGGYQSNTTKSRLNAILFEFGLGMEKVFQKNWDWYVVVNTGNGAMSTVDFRSGMRLA